MERNKQFLVGAVLAGLVPLACETPMSTVTASPEAQFAKGGKKPPPTQNTSVTVTFPAGALSLGYRIYGDAVDGSGTYADGECGVVADILGSTQDAWLNPDQEWNSRLGCDARSVTFDYSCEVGQPCTPGMDVQSSGARMTIEALGNVTFETDVWASSSPVSAPPGFSSIRGRTVPRATRERSS